jgi:hypothetical protein
MMAGQSVGLIKEIKTAKKIIDQIMAQTEAIIGNFNQYKIPGPQASCVTEKVVGLCL